MIKDHDDVFLRRVWKGWIGFLLSFLITLTSVTGHAQDMLGATLGNYSGVNGIQLNPSVMSSSRNYLDVNILSGDIFADNNYLSLGRSEYRFTHFFQRGYEFPSHPESYGTSARMLYWDASTNGKNAFVNIRINGPGVEINYGRHSFALTTAVRTVASVVHLPNDVANFIYLGLNYRPQHNIDYKQNMPLRAAAMTWGEIGLSYSYAVYQRNYNELAIGISAKRLFGYMGAYAYVGNADYVVPDDSTIIVNNAEAEFGVSIPVEYGSEIKMWNNKLIKGGGFGFDVGATYTRLKRLHQNNQFSTWCAQIQEPYEYRLGIALVDIGAIRFKDHALAGKIDNKSSLWDGVNHYKYSGVQQLFDTISYKFLGNNSGVYTSDKFYLWLPTALSIQFDYNIVEKWYVNGSFLYGLPLAHASLVRPAVLAVTPRYETRWFEANLPVSLYNWTLPRVGVSLRFWWVTVGTEKLGQFFNLRPFTGMDFYFSVKYSLEKGNCRNRQKGCTDQEAYKSK